jgi:predicted PolB exonuclease-like 3'-5' exonuclease
MPEFNQVLCIIAGLKVPNTWEIRFSRYLWDEKAIITRFFCDCSSHILSWYNIKNFDIPFIIKRAIKYKIPIPDPLKFFWKKPRETENIIDLQDVWKHTWRDACSLDVLTRFLWFISPKEFWIDGSQVQEFCDTGRYDEVYSYCERDVKATIEVYDRFKELNLI